MIKSLLRIGALLAALHGAVAYGQNAQPVIPLTGAPLSPVSGSNPLPVSGTFTASLSGFQPSATGARGTPLAVTTSDSSGALPTGAVVVVSNVGSNPMYCNVNGIAATTADQLITTSGGWFAFTIPAGITTLHCIATGGATTADTLGGAGLPTGAAAGAGGASGGAVFGPTAAGSAAANPPVIVGGTVDGTAAGNVANWKVVSGIGSINTAQVNGITTLAGAGAVGTGALRVAVGQDATTIAGSALGLTVGSPLFVSPGTGASFALETGGNLAQIVTDFGAPGATACTTDTASCSLNQQIQRLAQRLTTINTTLGTPFQAGGSLASNQSINVAQVNGVTTLTGTGAVGTGAQRVAVGTDTATIAGSAPGTAGTASANVISIQGIASMTKILVTPDSVALPANQSVNVAQINGVTPLMGNGTTGTGSPRVSISSDNSPVAGLGAVATGAAPPANAIYFGANASGATGGRVAGLISCDNHVFKHITTATDTVAVQGVASQTIYVCGWRSRAAGTATWFLENTASANNNCSSANTQITGLASEVVNSGETILAPFWTGLKNTSGNGLCINSTGTGGVDVDVWYTQF